MCKNIYKAVVISFCAVIFCGCAKNGSAADTGKNTVAVTEEMQDEPEEQEEKEEPASVITAQADLTHDGNLETVEVSIYKKTLERPQGWYILNVYDKDEVSLFYQELNLSHPGWASYYLVEDGEEAYLLYYSPEIHMETGTYCYRVFYLDESGNELEVDSGEVVFYISSEIYGETLFPEEEMAAFAEGVNQYLENGYLLIDTMDGNLHYSKPDNKIVYREKYEALLRLANLVAGDDIEENIKAYHNYLLTFYSE